MDGLKTSRLIAFWLVLSLCALVLYVSHKLISSDTSFAYLKCKIHLINEIIYR